MTFEQFAERVGELYGNPNAVFAGKKIEAKRPVRVLLESKTVDAIATGEKKKGRHVLKYTDKHGRRSIIRRKSDEVLVAW